MTTPEKQEQNGSPSRMGPSFQLCVAGSLLSFILVVQVLVATEEILAAAAASLSEKTGRAYESKTAPPDVPAVAAAADLKFALEELAESFRRDTRRDLKLLFGSSGTFATQIRHGAPFQMYLSADEDYVLKLRANGLTRDEGVLYAVGRIVLFAPPESPLNVDGEMKGLARLIKARRLQRFAIANPEHAPYGRRAEEALKHARLWEAIQPFLVFGENVAQAAHFAGSGSADGGIIALSLAKSKQIAKLGRYAVIPSEWHAPLKQRMVLLQGAGQTAQAFYAYVQQPAARVVLRRYGFVLPGEAA
jgi:molybdate transport system substrate-binding protein